MARRRNLAFVLTMPNNNAWNGRWTGEDTLHALVRPVPGARIDALGDLPRSFYYDFGDGWGASVKVYDPGPGETRTLRKRSAGFCGYDWMVDQIIEHGRILKRNEQWEETT